MLELEDGSSQALHGFLAPQKFSSKTSDTWDEHGSEGILSYPGLQLLHVNPRVFHARDIICCAAAGDITELQDLLARGQEDDDPRFPRAFVQGAALDAAVRSGQLTAARILHAHVRDLSSSFLTAAVEGGCLNATTDLLGWALQVWFSRFSCRQKFGPSHLRELYEALRLACTLGTSSQALLLLTYLQQLRIADGCLHALKAACAAGHPALVQELLQLQAFVEQLARSGLHFRQQAAAAVADSLGAAAASEHLQVLHLLLTSLTAPEGTLAPVQPLLGPHMQQVYLQVAAAGQTAALKQLLVQLPEHADSFDHSVLSAALSAGHTATADVVCWLLALRYSPSELQQLHQCSAGLASARLAGQLKAAAAAADRDALQATLAVHVPGEAELLQAVQAAAAAGSMETVALLVTPCSRQAVPPSSIMRALCMGACSSGHALLLQAVELESSELQQHLRHDMAAVADYLVAAVQGSHLAVATWLLTRTLQPWAVLESALQVLLTQHRLLFLPQQQQQHSSTPTCTSRVASSLLLELLRAAERAQPTSGLLLSAEVVSLLLVVGAGEGGLTEHVSRLLAGSSDTGSLCSRGSAGSSGSVSRQGSGGLADVVAVVRM